MKNSLSFLAPILGGVVFAFGLGLSGMTEPAKIIGFLDVTGNWDPSLIFVMIGAICVNALAYFLTIKLRTKPLFAPKFQLPNRTDIDKNLILGALIFGVGWGVAGLCPGPGLTALISGSTYAISFVGAMLIGMFLTKRVL